MTSYQPSTEAKSEYNFWTAMMYVTGVVSAVVLSGLFAVAMFA